MDDNQLLKEFEDEMAARIKLFHVEQMELKMINAEALKLWKLLEKNEATQQYAYPFPHHIGTL